MVYNNLLQSLKRAPQLATLCTQNGWIDNDTLRFEVIERQGKEILLAVQFDEVIMEGSGCVADRKSCYGRVSVIQNNDSSYQQIKVVLGTKD
jgi:hypothetical protein